MVQQLPKVSHKVKHLLTIQSSYHKKREAHIHTKVCRTLYVIDPNCKHLKCLLIEG